MRAVLFFCCAVAVFGWNPQEDINVNSRYTVDRVNVVGAASSRIPLELRRELDAVVGQKLDNGLLQRLAARIRHDLRVQTVSVHVKRGQIPDHVTVEFDTRNGRSRDFDVDIPKLAYHSRQGFTGIAEATTTVGNTAVTIGAASDADELVERFSGIRARIERQSLGTKRLRLRFEFENYHEQWDPSTVNAFARDTTLTGLDRSRRNFHPTATVVIAKPLTWSFGVSFEQLQFSPAHTEAANAAESTLRYHKTWEDGESGTQALDAGYSLRAATRMLDSDYVYVRHSAKLRYELHKGRNELNVAFAAGGISGRAPMFERFVLGNASTLRGWNKYDLDPLGGDRAIHGSVDYRYRFATVFYDTGVLWNGPVATGTKRGAGIGFRSEGKDGLLLAVAFPLRSGHVDPIFIAGFNF